MDVKKEIKAAKRLQLVGLIIAAVSIVFIVVSLLLSIYSYADLQGWERLKNLVSSIFAHTNFPVIGGIWNIAAIADFSEPLQVKNLGFLCELVLFTVGAAMVATANITLRDIAKASHDATQERRKEQLKKEQEKLSEQQRVKERS
ncbi:hypothetical protein [Pseudomonas sp. NPDC089569]|uniref:hypothetical protein n=1 Tax=Pseudomonas sp. NPDC089569 TaxID=3390722 RepID=UPI003D00F811